MSIKDDELKHAAEHLLSLRESMLFTVQQDGDSRSSGRRGVGVTWNIWSSCKIAIFDWLKYRDQTTLSELTDEQWRELVMTREDERWFIRFDDATRITRWDFGMVSLDRPGNSMVLQVKTLGQLRHLLAAIGGWK